jgi:transcriptional regulator with XRE-family HTH domain
MNASVQGQQATLGAALRSIRKERGWSLVKTAEATGLSISTLSKIENGQRSLTYDKLVQLAAALSVDIARLFTVAGDDKSGNGISLFSGRRSVQRKDEGFKVPANVYDYTYLAHDLKQKRFTPVIMDINARSIDEFETLIKHNGDELAYVLEGQIDVHSEIYGPLHLEAGESVFFDSGVGHAYVNAGPGTARILCIGSDVDGISAEPMISFAQTALAKAGEAAIKFPRRVRKPASPVFAKR